MFGEVVRNLFMWNFGQWLYCEKCTSERNDFSLIEKGYAVRLQYLHPILWVNGLQTVDCCALRLKSRTALVIWGKPHIITVLA